MKSPVELNITEGQATFWRDTMKIEIVKAIKKLARKRMPKNHPTKVIESKRVYKRVKIKPHDI